MERFTQHSGLVLPLNREDVDTDQIIPKQFLKGVSRSGMDRGLFHDWRYLDGGQPDPGFVLNDPRFRGASVLVAGRNFGCGSSREHAAWALLQHGFRVVIAPSLADIFRQNCYQNGILPLELDEEQAQDIMQQALQGSGYSMSVDLERQIATDSREHTFQFRINQFRKRCMLQGLDAIALTLEHQDRIANYEARHCAPQPSQVQGGV